MNIINPNTQVQSASVPADAAVVVAAPKVEPTIVTKPSKVDTPIASMTVDPAKVAIVPAAVEVKTPVATVAVPSSPIAHIDTSLQAKQEKAGNSQIVVTAIAEGPGDVSASASASDVVGDDGVVNITGNDAANVDTGDGLKMNQEDSLDLIIDNKVKI